MALGETYYRFETADGCSIISLLPELNDKQWADIERVGTELVDRLSTVKSPRIIVDLSALTYMGSAMVALIVRLYKSVTGRDGKMVVVNQHELVQEVLKLAGLAKLWTIVDSREKAFASLGIKPGSVRTSSVGAPGGNALLIGGIIGTVGAIVGLALQFSPSPIVSAKIAQLIEIAFAMLGMVTGTMTLVYQTGARRNVGIGVLVVCLLVVLGGILAAPDHSTKSASSAGTSTDPAPTTPAPAPKTSPASTTPTGTNVAASTATPATATGAKGSAATTLGGTRGGKNK